MGLLGEASKKRKKQKKKRKSPSKRGDISAYSPSDFSKFWRDLFNLPLDLNKWKLMDVKNLALLIGVQISKGESKKSLIKKIDNLLKSLEITLKDVIHELKAGLGINIFSIGRKRDDSIPNRDLQQIYGSPGNGIFVG